MKVYLATEQVTLDASVHGVHVQLVQMAGLGVVGQGSLGIPL